MLKSIDTINPLAGHKECEHMAFIVYNPVFYETQFFFMNHFMFDNHSYDVDIIVYNEVFLFFRRYFIFLQSDNPTYKI